MKRREFMAKAGAGVGLASLPLAAGVAASKHGKPQGAHGHGQAHEQVTGPLASATVSFGQWPASLSEPLDRFPNEGAPAIPNSHHLIPYEAMIKAGGSVNFVIAGFHQVIVYGGGKQPSDVDTSLVEPTTPLPLINDPENRIYRGVSPFLSPQDRVEVVQFTEPGTYLVICGFLFHFQEGMFGWVKVNP